MAFTTQDHERIAKAIAAAEARTDGEVLVILASQSDSYRDIALHYALLAAAVWLMAFAAVPDEFLAGMDRLAGGWALGWSLRPALGLSLSVAAAIFLLVAGALQWTPLRVAMVPRSIKTERCRRCALTLFKVGTERRTAARNGVLLYLSRVERQAEIIADESVHERVPSERWGQIMAALVLAVRAGRDADGIEAAVTAIGTILSDQFPFTGTDPGELPNHAIEI